MQTWIIDIIERFGYVGAGFLILLENIFPPIPSEVILTFGGFATVKTSIKPVGLIIAATAGSLAGAYILYFLGRLINREKLTKLIRGRVGRMLGFKEEDLKLALIWFARRGRLTVFLCRCIPIVRSLISIPAGMAGMDILSFSIFTLLGTVLWNTVLIYAGVLAGASWGKIAGACDTLSGIVLVIMGVAALNAILWLLRRKQL